MTETGSDRIIAGLRQALDGHRAALDAAYDFIPGSKENARLRAALEVARAFIADVQKANRQFLEEGDRLLKEIDYSLQGGAGS